VRRWLRHRKLKGKRVTNNKIYESSSQVPSLLDWTGLVY
jgi:hypothetical protein